MKVVLQRVGAASVTVEGETVGSCGRGLLLLVGIGPEDDVQTLAWMAKKVVGLRIFPDEQGRMNHDVRDVGGGVLAVSQFTLYGDCRKGRRPSFVGAAPPELASPLYDRFCELLEAEGVPVGRGLFGADMQVDLQNDGPVTLILER